jgi:hypothetical protein
MRSVRFETDWPRRPGLSAWLRLPSAFRRGNGAELVVPELDVRENIKSIVIEAELPGVRKSGERVMIALEGCIAPCGLTEEEVLALAEHEHLPEIVACALADYLVHQEHGPERIRDMIVDDVRAAQARGDREHVRTLLHVFHHFLMAHPHALPPPHVEHQACEEQG